MRKLVKKATTFLLVMILLSSGFWGLVGCNKLSQHQAEATQTLQEYVFNLGEENYSIESWQRVLVHLENGKQAIDNATNIDNVELALAQAKQRVNAVTQLKNETTGYSECGRFLFMISVYDTTIFYGESFIVDVGLKNISGERLKVGWNFGFFPHIPLYINFNCPYFYYPYTLQLATPEFRWVFLENNEVLRNLTIWGDESPEGIYIQADCVVAQLI